MSLTNSLAILIPVYQNPMGLERTLQSIANAELPAKIHTLVVDDGSQPPLNLDVTRFERVGLIIYRLENNQGIERALNKGLEIAEELDVAYVARLDAGDRADRNRFTKQLARLEQRPTLGIVGSDVMYIDVNGRGLFRYAAPQLDSEIRRRMHINSCLAHPAVMMRMSVLKEVGKYSTAFPAAEDYDLFFRILEHHEAESLREPLTSKILEKNSISMKRRRTQLISRLRIQRKYFDTRLPESYLGVASTLLLLLIPNSLLMLARRVIKTTRH